MQRIAPILLVALLAGCQAPPESTDEPAEDPMPTEAPPQPSTQPEPSAQTQPTNQSTSIATNQTAKFQLDAEWQRTTIDNQYNDYQVQDFKIIDGQPAVLFQAESATASLQDLLILSKFNGTAWNNQIVHQGSPGGASMTEWNGTIYIAYLDNTRHYDRHEEKLYLAQSYEGGWKRELVTESGYARNGTVMETIEYDYLLFPDIAISNDQPMIKFRREAWRDTVVGEPGGGMAEFGTNFEYVGSRLQAATKLKGNWQTETILDGREPAIKLRGYMAASPNGFVIPVSGWGNVGLLWAEYSTIDHTWTLSTLSKEKHNTQSGTVAFLDGQPVFTAAWNSTLLIYRHYHDGWKSEQAAEGQGAAFGFGRLVLLDNDMVVAFPDGEKGHESRAIFVASRNNGWNPVQVTTRGSPIGYHSMLVYQGQPWITFDGAGLELLRPA